MYKMIEKKDFKLENSRIVEIFNTDDDRNISIYYDSCVDGFMIQVYEDAHFLLWDEHSPSGNSYILSVLEEKLRLSFSLIEACYGVDFSKLHEYREYIRETFKSDLRPVDPKKVYQNIKYLCTTQDNNVKMTVYYEINDLFADDPLYKKTNVLYEYRCGHYRFRIIIDMESGDIVCENGSARYVINPDYTDLYEFINMETTGFLGLSYINNRHIKYMIDLLILPKAKSMSEFISAMKYLVPSSDYELRIYDEVVTISKEDRSVRIFTDIDTDKVHVLYFEKNTIQFNLIFDDGISMVRSINRYIFECTVSIKPIYHEEEVNSLMKVLSKYREKYVSPTDKLDKVYRKAKELPNNSTVLEFMDCLLEDVSPSKASRNFQEYHKYVKKGTKEFDFLLNAIERYNVSDDVEIESLDIYIRKFRDPFFKSPIIEMEISPNESFYTSTFLATIDEDFNIRLLDFEDSNSSKNTEYTVYPIPMNIYKANIIDDNIVNIVPHGFKEYYFGILIQNTISSKLSYEDSISLTRCIDEMTYMTKDDAHVEAMKILEESGILKEMEILLDKMKEN